MKKYAIILTFLLSLISSIILFSQTLPNTINYQGVLKDGSGVVVPNGDYNIKFTIYDNDVEIWTETKSVTVNDGIVNTQLGSVTPINLPFDNEYYLGIRIGTESELIPRLKLSSVPYSYMSMNVPDGSITAQKLNDMGATNGQVLKWNGTTWNPAGDETGADGLILPYNGTISTGNAGIEIVNSSSVSGTTAIRGIVSSDTPVQTWGVVGRSNSTNGIGVLGGADSETGINYGVFGKSLSSSGYGVYGWAQATTGATSGVYGRSSSDAGYGIYGYTSNTSGHNYGVYGRSSSNIGIGVGGDGFIGVLGTGNSGFPNCTGVYGFCQDATSTTVGVKSYVASLNSFSGYFLGGKFYVSGNVGIGTETPEYRLVVEAGGTTSTGIGAFRNSNGENKVILRQNSNGSGAVNIYKGDNTVALSLIGDGYSYFNGGRVGIGTDTPTQMLHVVGNAYKTEGGTAWATSSDIRLKDVLGNYEKGLNEIAALQPVRYIYKKDNQRKIDSSTEQVGFVAQDVQKIFPEAVTEAEDGYLDFNIHSINVALVNAIKELKAENDKLKETNEQLLKRLEKIENYLSTTAMK